MRGMCSRHFHTARPHPRESWGGSSYPTSKLPKHRVGYDELPQNLGEMTHLSVSKQSAALKQNRTICLPDNGRVGHEAMARVGYTS